MSRLAVSFLAMTVAAAFWAQPHRAAAASGWGWPVPETQPLLEYGASYPFDGGTRTHSGVDLAAEPGETIRSVAAGSVRFAGAVPAAGGGTVLAVTVDIGEGRSVSLLPLARLDVVKGERVEQGQRLGDLAESGDRSSDVPHLHLGTTLNGARIDPMTLLPAIPAEAADAEPEPEPNAPATPPTADPVSAPAPGSVQPAPAAGTTPSSRTDQAERTGRSSTAGTSRAPAAAPSSGRAPSPRAAARPLPATPGARKARIQETGGAGAATGRAPASVLGSHPPVEQQLLSLPARLALAQQESAGTGSRPDLATLRSLKAVATRLGFGLGGACVWFIALLLGLRHVREHGVVLAAVPAEERARIQ